jgi:hypothetical protein
MQIERMEGGPKDFRKQFRNGFMGMNQRTDFSLNRAAWDLLQPSLLQEKTAIRCAMFVDGANRLQFFLSQLKESSFHRLSLVRGTDREQLLGVEPSRVNQAVLLGDIDRKLQCTLLNLRLGGR